MNSSSPTSPRQFTRIAFLTLLLAPLTALSADPPRPSADTILMEAEAFTERGGWVVDPQFMDMMGSPYLLAHGLGRPVSDARTEMTVAEAGTYRVWVRTKDWVAQWKAPGAPGKFQLLVGGRALETTFGTEGAEWHWQAGGKVELPAGKISLSLHDLTGFEGRCDAILFTRDAQFTPPNDNPSMAEFRRRHLELPEKPEARGEFDFVVTGGGIAGTCAALSAARLGLKVALVQDRPVLGGNNSSEVRVWLQGARNDEPWPRIGDVVAELEQDKRAHYGPSNTKELYEDEKKLAVVRAEKNITLLLEHRVNAVEAADGRIRAVIAQSTTSGRRVRLAGKFFADCTGDAAVGALAGADFEMKPEGRMGPCNLWNVCECKDTDGIGTATEVSSRAEPFPRCPWALDLSDKPFPGRNRDKPEPNKLGSWEWESGFDRDPIREMESIRDWNFRAMYGAWDALKNVDQALPNHRLNWAAYILGKRESRRLMGDVVLTFDDLKMDRHFPDGCAPTGWNNDLHRPDPKYVTGFEGNAFISTADHLHFPASLSNRAFWIPYRCLYSRNISNLFMAGRNISVTADALGAVRVMRTCGTMGEVIGMAASLCVRNDIPPRAVYEQHLGSLQSLMARGTGKLDGRTIPYDNQGRSGNLAPAFKSPPPPWLKTAGENLARHARVTTSAQQTGTVKDVLLINDGDALVENNNTRWIQRSPLPHDMEFAWDKPKRIGAARIISGHNQGGVHSSPITDFHFQWDDGNGWKDIALAQATGNQQLVWSATFAPVEARRLRLEITRTPGGASRIWEVELYAPPDESRPSKP